MKERFSTSWENQHPTLLRLRNNGYTAFIEGGHAISDVACPFFMSENMILAELLTCVSLKEAESNGNAAGNQRECYKQDDKGTCYVEESAQITISR